jgi:lipid II:glycine glycyltransferase (peptidoglycan interpeptide bridge formation enzyme)
VLDLGEGEERLFSRFRDSTKRNIRKAGKEGVSVKISASSDSLEEFYRLNCMTRKDHGLPPQPFHFFRHIQEHLLAQGMGIMALGSYQGHTIAGCLYLHVGNKAYYKYGASNKKFQHLRANNLVMWEAIRWYSRNGYRTFCFGRTEPENEGLRQFKMGWGTKENPLYYYRYDLAKNQFVKDRLFIFGIHNKVFLHLPVSISKTIGTLLYKHMA